MINFEKVGAQMKRLEEFEKRLKKLEEHGFEDTLTLVEILSSVTFFGGLKMEKCKYAREGQCGLFLLRREAKKRIPIATDCKIRDCKGEPEHCHLELSNVTCAFCPCNAVELEHKSLDLSQPIT